MKYKILIQPDETLCGVTCLGMICEYYGIKNISLTTIRNFAQTDREGNTINSLCIAAEKLHMDAQAVKCTKNAIVQKKANLPLIAHTIVDGLYNHYMVIFEATDQKVILGDPAQGQIEMLWEEFEKIWTNKCILLTPTENFMENKKYKRNYKYIINLLLKYKKQIITMTIMTGIISGISMVSTWFYSYLIDTIIPTNRIQALFLAVLGIVGVFVLTVELNVMKEKYNIKFNKMLDRDLVIDIYSRITNLPLSFYSMRTVGDIQARYSDGDNLRDVIVDFSLDFVIQLAYAIWALVLVLGISWQMFVVALVMQELLYLMQKLYKKRIEEQTKEEIKKETDVDSFVMASFDANETIKNFNSEKLIEKKMATRYKLFQDIKYKNAIDQVVHQEVISIISNVGSIFMLGILGIFVMDGSITIGQLVTAYMYVGYIFTPMSNLSEIREEMAETKATLERLEDVFATSTEEERDKKKQNIMEPINEIEFKDVVFKYGFHKPTLKGISFKVSKGESIGIIGESGCGKTTLIKLIMGFYDIDEGTIFINGKNIDSYTKSSLRRRMAYVSQNDYWFKDTIFNNLTIGNENAKVDELDNVCKMVKMDDYISNSVYGYNSIIEEGGTNLSSGQKQRLSIAKALITHPDVLILDESTANLDANTEEYVVEQLQKEADKIKIIVAHRLNTLIHCNKIISIKDGVIIEMGEPKELLKQNGMFNELWSIQNKVITSIADGSYDN